MGLFRDRVLPFDIDAARRYADLAVTAKPAGEDSRHLTATSQRLRHREISSWRHATLHPMRRSVYPSSIRGKCEDQ